MPHSREKCDVLVVGAGPVGLFLAGELRRHGVDCRLIDKSSGPCVNARATGIQPRTLEILEHIGMIDAFLPQGVPIRGVKTYANNRLIAERSLSDLDSPFCHELSMPQSRTERLLIEYLGRRGQTVERNLELLSFKQLADGVHAVLRSAAGGEFSVAADYLVGCDGAHSTVRHLLGMQLEGTDYPAAYAVADLQIDGPLSRDEVTLYISPNVGVLLVPLPDDRCLMACDIPEGQPAPADGCNPTVQELQACLDQAGPGNMRLHDPAWLSYFHCHKRLSPHYRVDRVFLAGDAAHVQSPAAGQGMNTGFQDGFNLAWKLAIAVRGAARPALLGSYHAERHYIGRQMLELSDQTHAALFEHHPALGQRALKWAASLLAKYHLIHPPVRTGDELRVSYHHSPIVLDHHSHRAGSAWASAPRAGDRAPDARLTVKGESCRLFELIREPRHHLLVFEGEKNRQGRQCLQNLATTTTSRYGSLIEPILIEHENAAELHKRYRAVQSCLYLIRPDGYIGFRSPTIDAEALHGYLEAIIAVGTHGSSSST